MAEVEKSTKLRPEEEEEDEDDEAPELEEADDGKDEEGEEGADGRGKQNRNEKKARKALQKLGLKPIPGVAKVTVKKSKQILFVINRPDVFKAATSDTFVIFGEAKVEDASASAQAEAAAQFARAPAAGGVDASRARAAAAASGAAAAAPAAAAAGGDEDASGVEEKDIKLVMDQAGVERSAAIRALKKNNSDIVSAIMELTM